LAQGVAKVGEEPGHGVLSCWYWCKCRATGIWQMSAIYEMGRGISCAAMVAGCPISDRTRRPGKSVCGAFRGAAPFGHRREV
jgi:hypothetical protein